MATRQTTLQGEVAVPEHWRHVDGIEDITRPPTDAELRWGITSEELDRRHSSKVEAKGGRERHCISCGNRVTEMTDGQEAGHAAGRLAPLCRFRAEELRVEPKVDGKFDDGRGEKHDTG